jgi:hypothetical protein
MVRVAGCDIAVRGRLLRIARVNGELYKFVTDPEAVVDAVKRSGARVDLFTFVPGLPPASPAFAYPMEWTNLAVLELSTFDRWWTSQIRVKTRNRARLASQRGVVVREVGFDDTLVEGVWRIYNEHPVRQGKRFRHYGKPAGVVRRELGTFLESSVFIGAFADDALVGFVKLTMDDARTQAGVMHLVAMLQHRDKAISNALIAEAVRACTARGLSHLVFASFSYRKQRDTLSDFKARNGFRQVAVPRYYVPITQRGALAYRLGLHRRVTDYLPPRWLDYARTVRRAWHARARAV